MEGGPGKTWSSRANCFLHPCEPRWFSSHFCSSKLTVLGFGSDVSVQNASPGIRKKTRLHPVSYYPHDLSKPQVLCYSMAGGSNNACIEGVAGPTQHGGWSMTDTQSVLFVITHPQLLIYNSKSPNLLKHLHFVTSLAATTDLF